MGEYRDFKSEHTLSYTTQILPFFEIGETLLLDQKKIKLNFKKRRLKEMDSFTIMISITWFF